MDEFIAYVEQFDLSGPVWIHEEFHGAHTYWFDESESANVPTVGGVRVDKARMFVDDAGDAMILLGFYDRCSEELSEHKLGESLTKKARVLFAVLENAFGPMTTSRGCAIQPFAYKPNTVHRGMPITTTYSLIP